MLPQSVRLVILGRWTEDWMQALHPNAEIWHEHTVIKEVISIEDACYQAIPQPQDSTLLTVILPLMEWHILNRPKEYKALACRDDVIKTLASKIAFDSYMHRIGLAQLCPNSYKAFNQCPYPVVLKRVDLNAGSGIVLVRSAAEMSELLKHDMWLQKEIILQQYIDAEIEYVSHLVCRDGEIFWHSTFAYTLNEHEVIRNPGNVKTQARVNLDNSVLNSFRNCLKPLEFSGPCNIDFKFDKKGNLKILEINPRLGGSLMQACNTDLLKSAIDWIVDLAIDRPCGSSN